MQLTAAAAAAAAAETVPCHFQQEGGWH